MRQNEAKISKIEINRVTQIESKLMKCTKMNENESKLTKIERIQLMSSMAWVKRCYSEKSKKSQ